MSPESLEDLDDGLGWLLEAAQSLNEYKPPKVERVPKQYGGGALPGNRPGDHYNRQASWFDILPRHGWKAVGRCGDKVYWRRPGKEHGWSATTGHCSTPLRGDLFYVFTTSAPPFEGEEAYSKFEAYTFLNHGGRWAEAAQALAAAGSGPHVPRSMPSRPPEPAPPTQNPTHGSPAPDAFCFRRIPFSALRLAEEGTSWIWKRYLARNGITMLSALWKAGKTTLLSHLLKALEADADFCGQPVRASRVLYVTEEHESLWAARRDALGIGDHCEAIVRPFVQRPSVPEWFRFINDLHRSLAEHPAELVVFDTVSNLWPVKDENDAAKVGEAIQPLRRIADGRSLVLIHHPRKSDGMEFTGSRGSGALPAFCDILLELRRHDAHNLRDRKRVLTGSGRYEPQPGEAVIELTEPVSEGTTLTPARYVVHGTRADTAFAAILAGLQTLLPWGDVGYTYEQIVEAWPDGAPPPRATLQKALKRATDEGKIRCSAETKRGSPHLYTRPPPEDG